MSGSQANDAAVDGPATKLKKACDDAHKKYPGSCSHAVWFVRTELIDSSAQYRKANQLIDELSTASDWEEVSVDDGWVLAQQGILVIGGLKKVGDHGHVIIIHARCRLRAASGQAQRAKATRPFGIRGQMTTSSTRFRFGQSPKKAIAYDHSMAGPEGSPLREYLVITNGDMLSHSQ